VEPLKNFVNPAVIEAYASELEKQLKGFDSTKFKNLILTQEWEQRELMDRIHHVAESIQLATIGSFNEIVEGIEKAAPNLPSGFEQIIFPAYIKLFGLEHYDRSLRALEHLTQYSTGEFAIRPFLKTYPDKTMQQMLKWSKHQNEHVRRFSSEGCRPRLPWGGNLPIFIKDPETIFPILKNLRNDESLCVRKSVANNLNDISKDHPETVLRIAACWQKENQKHTDWIIKHALRSLLKKPHPKALELFGYGKPSSLSVNAFCVSKKAPKMGEAFEFKFNLRNASDTIQKIRVEYVIDFKKKRGSAEKVFQISEFELGAVSSKEFSKKHSFQELSTRKHYPGKHFLSIRLNGVVKDKIEFELISDYK
jgi:3-methyladenine DNA glycosylase AlkC